MNIRRLSPDDENKAKEIWKICFGDSDDFLKVYFSEVADWNASLGYYDKNELVADLFMLDFCPKLANHACHADFLAGCATLPQARKRGLMRELVRYAMLDMRKRGRSVTYLHPFLHAFYRKFGYGTIAYIERKTRKNPKGSHPHTKVCRKMEDVPIQKMVKAYREYMKRFDNCFLRDEKRFSAWLRLLFADGGEALVYDDGSALAYALYYKENEIAEVFELVPGHSSDFLEGISASELRYFLPAYQTAEKSKEFTMMRVLEPEAVLRNAHIAKDEFVIHVYDEFLEEEGRFLVRKEKTENRVFSTKAKADIEASPEELAAMVTGVYQTGKAAEYFVPQTSCFFETY